MSKNKTTVCLFAHHCNVKLIKQQNSLPQTKQWNSGTVEIVTTVPVCFENNLMFSSAY